jgi:hypothetical protein
MSYKPCLSKHRPLKYAGLFLLGTSSLGLLSACPWPIAAPLPEATPTPLSQPTASPTPEPIATPVNSTSASPTPQRTPFPLETVLPEDRVNGDFFTLEFGPGSKGLETTPFGPGSKGLEQRFGPGSKGLENLRFDVNFQETLVRSGLAPFNTKQFGGRPLIQRLRIELVRDNQLYAVATVLPALPLVHFGARVHPGRYSMFTVTESDNAPPVQISWSQVEITETEGTQVRIGVYSSGQKPEDLDIELLTRKIPLPTESPSVEPTPSPTATP